MDNADDETTYQLYAVKNDDDAATIDFTDVLNLPSCTAEPDNEQQQDNNKQIFYLTFDNANFNDETSNNDDKALLHMDNTPELLDNNALYSNDVKLITLEDGTMFMTTDQVLANVQADSLLLNPTLMNNDSQEILTNNSSVLKQEESMETTEESNSVNYQLIQLADGSQAIIKMFKIEDTTIIQDLNKESSSDNQLEDVDEEEEEPPKKVKKFQCLYEGCNKFYATSYHLTVHTRSHTDCKPFACHVEGCEKKFSTNYSLKAHIRTHTGEKPYGCTICTKEFKTSGDLQKHIRIHTGEKPFVCPFPNCGKSFTTSNIRKVHIRSHTGERPYSCNYPHCGKAFTSSTNYKNHLRIHSGEKPYVCPVEGCGKRFTEYSSLYKHNAVHQPVRPYCCLFCGQKFKQETAMNFHKRLKHNVVVTKDGTEIIVKIE